MSFHGNYLMNLGSIALGRQPARPLLFSYYVTYRCGLNCAYCSDGVGNPFKKTIVEELDTNSAKRLITILSRTADTLDVTGGEPMMRIDLEEILDHARRSGMRTALNTKGIGLAERPGLLRSDVLVLGIDSLHPERLAELYGCGLERAEAVLTGLEFAMSHREATKTRVVLSAVAMPGNLADVAEVLEFAVKHRLGFHLSPQIDGVTANPVLQGNAEYDGLMAEVIRQKRAGHGVFGVGSYLAGIRDFGQFRCHPLLMPIVRPDGKMVYPCLERPEAQISILDAGSYLAALEQARQSHGPIPECRNCCHIFCHMALSLLQRHPLEALGEARHWAAIR